MATSVFAPGFRLSTIDVVVLIAGAVGTYLLGAMVWWWGFILAFVLGHFFLFCNVFRIARSLELTWAAIFIVLASRTIMHNVPSWPVTILETLAVTITVIVIEIRKPSYHGIGWQRFNPNLPVWWETHVAGPRKAVEQPVLE